MIKWYPETIMSWNKEMAAGVKGEEEKYNTKEVELVGFGDWENGGQNRSRFENDSISGLCYLMDYVKVNQDWEYKRKAS